MIAIYKLPILVQTPGSKVYTHSALHQSQSLDWFEDGDEEIETVILYSV